jgi:uncharacterized protein (TIGR00251 family)
MIADAMLSADGNSVLIAVRVTPRAARTEIAGVRGGRLVVRVTAPPLEGRANDALRRLLAKATGVAASRVEVVGGERGRDKLVRIEGLALNEARRALL